VLITLFVQVIAVTLLPAALVFLILLLNDRTTMGERCNTLSQNLIGGFIVAVDHHSVDPVRIFRVVSQRCSNRRVRRAMSAFRNLFEKDHRRSTPAIASRASRCPARCGSR
jgi:hypothetical protein